MEEENRQTKKELGLRKKYGRRPEEEKELGSRRKGRKGSLKMVEEEIEQMKMELERREKKSKDAWREKGRR